MAEDISNKTLALLVGLAILVSLVGIFSVQKGGITGAQVANVTTQTGSTNFSLATVVSIILDDDSIQFGQGFINSSVANNVTLDSFAGSHVGGGDFQVGNVSGDDIADSIRIRNQGSVDFQLDVQSNTSANDFVNASGSNYTFKYTNSSTTNTSAGIGNVSEIYRSDLQDTAGACASSSNGTFFGNGSFTSNNSSHTICNTLQFEGIQNEIDFFVQILVPETATAGDKISILTFTATG